jgi:hypothetical protein
MKAWLRAALALAGGAVVFWIAYDGGSYAVESRATLAIAVWWTLLMAVVLGLWPLVTPPRAGVVAGGLLAALTVLTGLSMTWAESAERAFTEFNRAALYLGVFLVALCAGTRGNVGRWLDGLAIGIVATGLFGLATRLFPNRFDPGAIPEFLPAAVTRLSRPVEYWNGLAILVALALPFLLRAATQPRTPALIRGLALAPFPPLAATLFLTSSRGGFACAIVAIGAFLALSPRRWSAAAAVATGGLGAVVAIAVVSSRDALVNEPFTPLAVSQGRSAALLLLLAGAATGIVFALGTWAAPRELRIPRAFGWATTAVAVVAVLAVVVAADPVARAEAFTDPPAFSGEETDFVEQHLLSGNGSGRWQFWAAAIDQWRGDPVLGAGAGSYEAWWAQHGSLGMFVRDAHSLYLEVLGELGVVGFGLLVALFVLALGVGLRRLRAAAEEERLVVAALVAAFLAYGVGVGIDWMWELTIVSVAGMAVLGLLTGPATSAASRPRLLTDSVPGERRSRRRFAAGVVAVTAAWLVVCAQAIPYLAEIKISDSQAASRRGDGQEALEHAMAARNIQPWAASPYVQLALVEEAVGDLAEAQRVIREGIERDPTDWRLWLIASRIETKSGDIPAARADLARAAELNPRSPLFASVR